MLTVINSVIQVQVSNYNVFMARSLKTVPVNHKTEHVHLIFIEVYRRFSLEIKYENGDMAKRKIYQIQ